MGGGAEGAATGAGAGAGSDGAGLGGFGVDAVFRSDARTLYLMYTGELALPNAQRSGRLELDCAPAVRRQVPTWFAWSGFAPAVREGMARRAATPRAGRA